MAKRGDAHEALSLLFKRDVVPPKTIFDSSKEQAMGDFKRKVVEAGCHFRQTKPEYLWKMTRRKEFVN